MNERRDDPYTVLMNPRSLPLSLIKDAEKISRMHILETDTFANTFGPKAQRKRPRLSMGSVGELASKVEDSLGMFLLFQGFLVLSWKLNTLFSHLNSTQTNTPKQKTQTSSPTLPHRESPMPRPTRFSVQVNQNVFGTSYTKCWIHRMLLSMSWTRVIRWGRGVSLWKSI